MVHLNKNLDKLNFFIYITHLTIFFKKKEELRCEKL